jgi:colanic acid biosynthesis glycosyl transferase WcaI
VRVLFVNQYYPPDSSATAYLLGELSEDLSRTHEVWVVAGRPSYSPVRRTRPRTPVRLRRAWSTGFSRGGMVGRLTNYATFLASSAAAVLAVPRPDVVVAMTDPPVVGLVGLLAARRHRAPFVYVCEDIFPDVAVALGRMDNPMAVSLWRRLNRLLRRQAVAVVAIGRDMAHKLEDEGVPHERIELIPNWASDVAVDPVAVADLRKALGWDDAFAVVHAGNVGLAQHLDLIVDAADRLRRRADIRIIIVGDGAARSGLERKTAALGLTNVAFLAHREKNEAQVLVAAADLHVVSLAPGLRGCVVPSKIYGILAHGRPFVAAVEAESEVDLVIREAGAGVRVDPGDAEGLAAAIETAAGDPEWMRRAGEAGRRAFLAGYTREHAVAAYRRLLEGLAGRTP